MQKDFDGWNERKKHIDKLNRNKLYHERDVWWCSLGINVGYEEEGTGLYGERPVLVLKGFSVQVCLVVPLTTSMKKNKYHVGIGLVGKKNAFAIISQIRLVDTKRLVDKICRIENDIFEDIRKAVKNMI